MQNGFTNLLGAINPFDAPAPSQPVNRSPGPLKPGSVNTNTWTPSAQHYTTGAGPLLNPNTSKWTTGEQGQTGVQGDTYASYQQQQAEAAAAEQARAAANAANVRTGINSAYKTRLAGLDGLTGAADQSRRSAEQQINNTYGVQKSGLQQAKDTGLRNLTNAEGQVEKNRDYSLRNLAESVRNSMSAMGAQLGNYGAADSSAADMTKYALAKMQNKSRGEVLNQTGDQLNEINMKRADTESGFQQQLRELDSWKGNQQLSIIDKLNQTKQQIMQERANTVAEQQMKLAALAEVDAAAIADIRALDGQVRQSLASIQSSIQGPNTNANALKATYDPREVAVAPVNANLGGPQQQANPYQANYVPPQLRRDEFGNPIA